MEMSSNSIEHHAFLLNYLASSFEKEECLDVAFVCKGGKIVKAHQLVLASVSPFLRALFNGSNTGEVCISLSEVDDRLLTELLTFMYEGTMKLPASDVDEFYEIIDMLGIKFPGIVYVQLSPAKVFSYTDNRKWNPLNGTEEITISSEDLAAVAVDSIEDTEIIRGDPDDDPLNIPDRYFVQPTASGSGQSNVKSVQPKPAPTGSKAQASVRPLEIRSSEASRSSSPANKPVENKRTQTGVSVRTRRSSATNEAGSHPGTSNGPINAVARNPASDSKAQSEPKSDSGGRKRRQANTENVEEKRTRKVTRSKDKESNVT